jgi:hypothetical protein
MSQDDVFLVASVFSETLAPDGRIDMGPMMEDDAVWARNAELFDPEVEVRFMIPATGGPQIMEQEFAGIDGLRAGWREWMNPWEEFLVGVEDVLDLGDGGVLMLAEATGRMRGTGAEVPQEVALFCHVDGGRLDSIGFYLDQDQARRDAGLK